jgi:uncharacterized protein (TIGR04255 family)
MLFSDRPRTHYANSQLREVICQLRFPTILSINEKAPADYQDAIRDAFPRYDVKKVTPPPVLIAPGTPQARVEQKPPILHHNFISSTGLWKIVLTQESIALSTVRYHSWEDFAQRLDRPLAEFIRVYRPADFERLGLRYLNIISRKALGAEDTPWRELISPAYLGVLNDPAVDENKVAKCSHDVQMQFPDETHLKLHAGPGRLQQNGQTIPETRFILDMDLFSLGQLPGALVPERISMLHDHAVRVFRGAITDQLHQLLGPSHPL